jgi:hypothetical protein
MACSGASVIREVGPCITQLLVKKAERIQAPAYQRRLSLVLKYRGRVFTELCAERSVAPTSKLNSVAGLKIGFEDALELTSDRLIIEAHTIFLVESERPVVEICGSDG